MRELARGPSVDLVVNGLVGSQGLVPTLDALECGHDVALANKEPLVVAGELVLAVARKSGARLLPLDSELSAIRNASAATPSGLSGG